MYPLMVDDTPLDRAREQLEDEDFTSGPEENKEVPLPHKKPGRKVNLDFLVPALGHPFEDSILDKDAMYVYTLDYAKQEGFAVNPCKKRRYVIGWRCFRGGKYRNTHHLPSEVTEKNYREELKASGTTLFRNADARPTGSTVHFVCCMRCQ
jgi:hypothetical protein